MPGSVRALVQEDLTTFPPGLCAAFSLISAVPTHRNDYAAGEFQSRTLGTERRRWRLARRLTASQIATLRAYYLARLGPVQGFIFTDVITGVSYTARFATDWTQQDALVRSTASFEIVEVQ